MGMVVGDSSLDQVLEVGIGPKDDVQPHFIGVAILILESAHLHPQCVSNPGLLATTLAIT